MKELAVLQGTAVHSDGKCTSLTAPNGQAQRQVVSAALASALTAPSTLNLMEVYGTGTALGVPMEIGSVTGAVLKQGCSAALAAAHAVLHRTEAVATTTIALSQIVYGRCAFPWCYPPHPFVQQRAPSTLSTMHIFRSPTADALAKKSVSSTSSLPQPVPSLPTQGRHLL